MTIFWLFFWIASSAPVTAAWMIALVVCLLLDGYLGHHHGDHL